MIAKGRSINVTLIFSLRRYAEVAESYMRGLERLVAEGGDPRAVASVASFFVSRIDTEADRRLEEIGAHDELQGKLAVANAKLAYAHYLETFAGPRWEYLAAKGATPQRVLWASTSTKNPAYPDTLYVEELIGPDTVNTMPEETIRAYQDHGDPQARPAAAASEEAQRVFEELEASGRRLRGRHRHARARGGREIRRVLRGAGRVAAGQARLARGSLTPPGAAGAGRAGSHPVDSASPPRMIVALPYLGRTPMDAASAPPTKFAGPPAPPSERGAWVIACALGLTGTVVLALVLSGVIGARARVAPPPLLIARVATPRPAAQGAPPPRTARSRVGRASASIVQSPSGEQQALDARRFVSAYQVHISPAGWKASIRSMRSRRHVRRQLAADRLDPHAGDGLLDRARHLPRPELRRTAAAGRCSST